MRYVDAVQVLEEEWERPEGFFAQLRVGVFDEDRFDRIRSCLAEIDPSTSTEIDRRFVSLLWYVPMFMEWQIERVAARSGDVERVRKATNEMLSIVEDLLGVP